MQTFLPYPDIVKSVKCLDNKRLGKQRVEALTLLKVLNGLTKGWKNHPVVKMWRYCQPALCVYGLACCNEWRKRGYKDNCRGKFIEYLVDFLFSENLVTILPSVDLPFWFGNKDFHDSHKSNLLRKNPEHYKQFNWDVPDNLPYIWPV